MSPQRNISLPARKYGPKKTEKQAPMGAWMIRAGRGGAYAADWLNRNVIVIG